MTANDRILSFIRTYVPYAVGAALAWLLATLGIDLRGEFEVALVAVLVVAGQNLYYLVVRLVEQAMPGAGFLLGAPVQPSYEHVDNLWASLVRTGFPSVIGALLFVIVNALGLHLDGDAQTGLVVILVAVAQALYYTAARAIAGRFPALTWLVGPDAPPVAYTGARHRAL
jgi:hypothetical protein